MQRLFEQSGISSKKSEALGSQAMLEHAKNCLSDQDIFSKKSEALDSQAILECANIIWSNQNIFSEK
jgi:hypothetical protein